MTMTMADTHEMNMNPPPPPYPTLPDVTTTQQQQQPGMTQHLREVRKNIQNRWSAGSPPGGVGGVAPGCPEEQHLLSSDAQDTPPGCGAGSPVPAPRLASFPPSNAQLQKVISDALLRERQQQSKVLSTTTTTTTTATMANPSQSHLHHPRQTTTTSSYSVSAAATAAAPPARQETIC